MQGICKLSHSCCWGHTSPSGSGGSALAESSHGQHRQAVDDEKGMADSRSWRGCLGPQECQRQALSMCHPVGRMHKTSAFRGRGKLHAEMTRRTGAGCWACTCINKAADHRKLGIRCAVKGKVARLGEGALTKSSAYDRSPTKTVACKQPAQA